MAGRLVVELESFHLAAKGPYFKEFTAFAVLEYKNEERRGQLRKLQGMVSNWGETFDFHVEGSPKADCIWMDVYKEEKMFDKKIGTCKILLYEAISQRGEPSRTIVPLKADGNSENTSEASNLGRMTVLVRYYPSTPQLEAALEKAEERVRELERELQLKLEFQRVQNAGEATTSSANAVTTLVYSDSLAATISKVEQLRLQTQVRKLENEMKWEENQKKWEENEKRWAENGIRWAENEMKWEENEKRWAENDIRWAENEMKWEEIEKRWAENDIRWLENEAKFSQIQVQQSQSLLEMCLIVLKGDLLNLKYHLETLIVGVKTWLTN